MNTAYRTAQIERAAMQGFAAHGQKSQMPITYRTDPEMAAAWERGKAQAAEEAKGQQPDTRPGPYYVSAIDGSKKYLMAGPYTTHAEALAKVDQARNIADQHDPRAWFMAWGTCRIEGSDRIGSLTKHKLI